MSKCSDCMFFKNENRDGTGLCTVHEQIPLPPYIEKEVLHINIVGKTDTCGLARAKLQTGFTL